MGRFIILQIILLYSLDISGQCSLPADSGPCNGAFERYYFDTLSQDCKTFTYGGCLGNANNYATYELCINACGSTCQLPPDPGPCRAVIERWYFDVDLGYCTTFNWGGCEGNANNYLTFEDCKAACTYVCDLPPDRGPCLAYLERYYFNSESGTCELFIYGGCGGNANNYETFNECITGCGIVCQLEPDPGPCNAAIPRFYFNTETGTCEEFIYGGCGGNANNYPTFNSCIEACGSVCQLEADPGPCYALIPRWYFDSGTGQCEEFNYGGCGGNANNYETKSACMEACGDVCYLEPDSGPCYALLSRWYYNPDIQDCQEFMYGGCGGNANNYTSYNACMSSCADVCDQPLAIGICGAAIPRYYFNKTRMQCVRFTYSGCQGNENNFPSLEACENACPCMTEVMDDQLYAFTMTDTVSSSKALSSSSILIDTSSILYSSGNYVELLPGFRIDKNARLQIEMNGCLED